MELDWRKQSNRLLSLYLAAELPAGVHTMSAPAQVHCYTCSGFISRNGHRQMCEHGGKKGLVLGSGVRRAQFGSRITDRDTITLKSNLCFPTIGFSLYFIA